MFYELPATAKSVQTHGAFTKNVGGIKNAVNLNKVGHVQIFNEPDSTDCNVCFYFEDSNIASGRLSVTFKSESEAIACYNEVLALAKGGTI